MSPLRRKENVALKDYKKSLKTKKCFYLSFSLVIHLIKQKYRMRSRLLTFKAQSQLKQKHLYVTWNIGIVLKVKTSNGHAIAL